MSESLKSPHSSTDAASSLLTLDVLAAVVSVAELAGQAIMAIYADEERWHVISKSDETPLTAADMAAHHCIAASLRSLSWPALAQAPLLSEESDAAAVADRHSWPMFWLVDPLDGTREFIARNGEFSVNIALVIGQEAVLGVIHGPATGTSYVAAKGLGAFRLEHSGNGDVAGRAPVWRSIQVASLPVADERPLRLTVSRRHGLAELVYFEQAVAAEFGPTESTPAGSAFKLCAVAEGRADAYPRFGPTSEWDTAAAQVVLEEAGGVLCDARGRRFRYNARTSLLNGSFIAVGQQPARWLACWPTGANGGAD